MRQSDTNRPSARRQLIRQWRKAVANIYRLYHAKAISARERASLIESINAKYVW